MAMEPYNKHTADACKLNSNDDWLRRRQGLALPALPPTTDEARQYFFSQIREFSTLASTTGKRKIDYEMFAREWNQSADGTTRFYITTDVLCAYAKTWEKISNIHASKELISDKLENIRKSRDIFAAPQVEFPTFLTGSSSSAHPRHGVIDLDQAKSIPPSLSMELAISRPPIALLIPSTHQTHNTSTINTESEFTTAEPSLQEVDDTM
jgi:hypothetical protein